MKIALVMPTMRDARSLQSFVELAPDYVDFIIMAQEHLTQKYERTTVFLDKDVFAKSWIFNRITKRNYGFLYAFNQGYDIVFSLDDDCFPNSNDFFKAHLDALSRRQEVYFNNLKLFSGLPSFLYDEGPRGFPRELRLAAREVVLNQGLWVSDVDLDTVTLKEKLGSRDGKFPAALKKDVKVTSSTIVPLGQYPTVCGMNMAFKSEIVPAFYQIYMEPEGYGVNRYEDIWAGLFLKAILDRLEKCMSVGLPTIRHDKAPRDIEKDLKYELAGREMNTFLWREIPKVELNSQGYYECYLELAEWLEKSCKNNSGQKFLVKVSAAMKAWLKLFDTKA